MYESLFTYIVAYVVNFRLIFTFVIETLATHTLKIYSLKNFRISLDSLSFAIEWKRSDEKLKMSSVHPEVYKLNEKIAELTMFDLLPFKEEAAGETREFLQKIVDILLDYITLCFDHKVRENFLKYSS